MTLWNHRKTRALLPLDMRMCGVVQYGECVREDPWVRLLSVPAAASQLIVYTFLCCVAGSVDVMSLRTSL